MASQAPLESFDQGGVALFERDDELTEIAGLIAAAQAGDGGLLLVSGPAGIGKTSLLEVGLHAPSGGVHVLAARGADLEQDFAFGVARQLFERPVAALPAAARRTVLGGPARLAAPLLGMGPEANGTETSLAIAHGLFWLACNLAARGPLVIALDDAQWADAPSARFLTYLARRLEGLPIALVVAVRGDASEPGLAADLAARDGAAAPVTELAPLSENGVRLATGALLGAEADPAFGAACHAATAGNPYYLRELLGQARAEGLEPTSDDAERVARLHSPAIARTVLARLAALPADATALAQATAVMETDVELRHAAALAELEPAGAAEAADLLAAADILGAGRPLRFVHPLVQASIYAAIPSGRRAFAHGRAAHLLAADGADPARVAAHLLMAEPAADPVAVEMLRRAAREAVARGAAEIAATYLRRALSEPPTEECRAPVLLELGRAEASTGEPDGFERIAAALAMTSDCAARAEVALDLGRGLMLVDRGPEAIDILDRARAELGDRESTLADRLEAESAGAALMDVATAADALERLRGSEPSGDGESTGERLLLAYGGFALAAGGGPAEAAADRAARALRDGGLADEQTLIPFGFAACTLALADRFDDASDAFHHGLDVAQRRGSSLMFAVCSWIGSFVEYRRGALAAAEAHARGSLDPGLEAWFTAGVAFLADALMERGCLDEADEAYRAYGLEGELFPDLLVANLLLCSRGRLRCQQGDPGAGLDDLLECGERLTRAGVVNPAGVAWRSSAALAHVALDDAAAARRLADEEVALARGFGAPRAIGVALRASGLVEARTGDPARGLELLAEAAGALEGSGARLEHGRALVDHGAALRRAGRRADAREPLRRGLDLASDCGATVLAGRAREELVAAGAKPRRERISGADALTASERRVAEMAADGMTNRQIAEALFVTMNTVAKHLTHVYEKLDVGDRSELAGGLGV